MLPNAYGTVPMQSTLKTLLPATLALFWLAACSQTPAGTGVPATYLPTDTSGMQDGLSGSDAGEAGADGSQAGADGGGATVGQDGGGIGPKSDGTGGTAPVNNYTGYASAELRIRVVGPSGRRHTVVSGKVVEVAGVIFGNADEVTWSHSGGASGTAYGSPFFQTGKIELNAGDNKVVVMAKKGQQVASDSITITYNPVFHFPDRLHAEPRVLKSGVATDVHVIVNVGKTTNFVANSLTVYRIDDTGNKVGAPLVMQDNGNLATNGDEIKGDGQYSAKMKINDSKPGLVRLRASILTKVGAQQYAAYTDIVELDVVDNLTQDGCSKAQSALVAAKAAATKAGGGKAGQQAAIDDLKASGLAAEVGPGSGSSPGVWVKFNNGLLGVVNLNAPGTRGGDQPRYDGVDELPGANYGISSVRVESKRALLLDPFAKELGANEIGAAFDVMQANACPAYTIEGGAVQAGAAANLARYRHMYDYGIVAMATHGDALFGDLSADARKAYRWPAAGSEEVVWTGHAIDCSYFPKASTAKTCSAKTGCSAEADCFLNKAGGNGVCVDHLSADVQRGRVVLGADGVYGITPAFVRHHAESRYPKSLVYLGACQSLWNGSLAAEFIAAGAAAVVGYTGTVTSKFATEQGKTLFSNLIAQKQLSGSSVLSLQDQTYPGTYVRLVGAKNLDAAYSNLMNESWETGDLTGWIKAGDGRVISKLGANVPVGGKFMSIISTGLGYTVQTGAIEQKFCVPAGVSQMTMWWKFYSEEFKEYCGSQFQDAFAARLEREVGGKTQVAATAVSVKVDDLCETNCKGSNSCFGSSCAGKCAKQFKGLVQSDVSFDQGDVWMTPWVQSVTDVTSVAGKGNVTLKLFTTDVGDSVYDTAVLMDKIDFK